MNSPHSPVASPVVSGKAAPRRRRKDARPAEVLAAALDLFIEKGFAATRLTDVAARAGVAKGTLYLYGRADLIPPLALLMGDAMRKSMR